MSLEYNQYLKEHMENVRKAYEWLHRHFEDIRTSDPVSMEALLMHDNSKYSIEEYDAYDKYFYGEKTPEAEKDFNYAWLHHIHNNPHHWQYWVLKHDDEPEEALEMPMEYMIEMICDWWSFSWKTGKLDEIFSWYEKHGPGMILHPNTRKAVEDILDKIRLELAAEGTEGK